MYDQKYIHAVLYVCFCLVDVNYKYSARFRQATVKGLRPQEPNEISKFKKTFFINFIWLSYDYQRCTFVIASGVTF